MTQLITTVTKEPLFAGAVKKRGAYMLWFDRNGLPACTNMPGPSWRSCVICGNLCVQYKVLEDGARMCAACGKFEVEELQNV
jgi:hypothetical protein